MGLYAITCKNGHRQELELGEQHPDLPLILDGTSGRLTGDRVLGGCALCDAEIKITYEPVPKPKAPQTS